MSLSFRLLTEADVTAVLTMGDLIDTMASALKRFSTGRVVQPVRAVIPVGAADAFFASMPAYVHAEEKGNGAALGAKLVTVFGGNAARGLHTHLATIVLLDPETGALLALLDGRDITESRTAAVSAVSSRLLARTHAASLAIIGSGGQAGSHLEGLARVHPLPDATGGGAHRAGPVFWGGAPPPTQREMDPALTARARLFVDSRAAALAESGDVVMGIAEGRFGADHIVAEIGELVNGAAGRRSDTEVTIFKSLGLAVEDVTAADLAYRRACERGVGRELTM